ASGSECRKFLRVGFPTESASIRAFRECLQRPLQSGRIEKLSRPKWKPATGTKERKRPRSWSSRRSDSRPNVVLVVAQCRRGSAKRVKAKPRRPRRTKRK